MKVCIGTDSQVRAGETEFATVIVFLREGHGGFMFIQRKDHTSVQYQRTYVGGSGQNIEIAYELCNLFTEFDVDMDEHTDINTNPQFKSNEALREAMGYILDGLRIQNKPEALPATVAPTKW